MRGGVTRRAVLRSAGSAAAIAAAGTVPAARVQQSGDWPTLGRDAANTGHAREGTGPTGDVGGVWRFDTDRAVASSPSVVDGTVYVGSNDTTLYALSAADGTEQWRFPTGGRVSSSPAVVEGTVYVGSEDGFVYAVDAATGEEVWGFETDDPVVASPTVADGTLYIGSRDGRVYAIDAADGTEQWSFGTGNDVSATPAVVDGTVYVGSEDWNVYAIDAATGEEAWRFETSGQITAAPAVSGDTVYAGSLDGAIYAIREGDLLWGLGTGRAIVASPAVADGTVYAGSRDGSIYALAADTGDQQWSFDTGWQVTGSPSVADGVVYAGTQGGDVFGIDAESGDQLWQFDAVRAVTAQPAIVDGSLFVGSATGAVYALAEGARLPVEPTPTPVAGGDDGGSGSDFAFLVLPIAVVALVGLLAGTVYAAVRAGLFEPIEARSPFPSDGDGGARTDANADSGTDADANADTDTTGSDGPALPVRDVVLDDVIARAEETSRTATEDLLVTKYVDRGTLSSPVVAYEIESVRRDPATVRITEPLDPDVDPDEAIGRLPGAGDEWRVEDGALAFEAEIDPDGIVRTIVARRDLSPEEADGLLDRPDVDVED